MAESNALKIINNSLASDRVFHSYIFVNETQYSGNARYLAKKILDTVGSIEEHPSVIYINGRNNIIKKEDVLSASNRLKTTLTHQGNRVLFIEGIEKGNKASLNSLLKLIEEPNRGIYIIMTTSNLQKVINTIVSRSQVIFDSVGKNMLSPERLREEGVIEEWIPFYSKINMPWQKIIEQYNSEFHRDLKDVLDILSKSLDNKSFITGPLGKIINKNNYEMVLLAVDMFYSDIWKLQAGVETIFPTQISSVNAYASSSFRYDIALKSIRDFQESLKSNANFSLAKSAMLINLEEAYG